MLVRFVIYLFISVQGDQYKTGTKPAATAIPTRPATTNGAAVAVGPTAIDLAGKAFDTAAKRCATCGIWLPCASASARYCAAAVLNR